MKIVRLLVAFVLLGTSWVTTAQDADEPMGLDDQSAYLGIRPDYQTCISQSDGSMPSMTECSEDEFAYQDRRLNLAYRRAMKSMPVEQRTVLRAEEREWIKEKDAECAVPDAPGQGQILDSIGCGIYKAARRARHLEHLQAK